MMISTYALLSKSDDILQKFGQDRSFTERATDTANEFRSNVTDSRDVTKKIFETGVKRKDANETPAKKSGKK